MPTHPIGSGAIFMFFNGFSKRLALGLAAAAAFAGAQATAQEMMLVPQGQSPGGQQRYLLVPSPSVPSASPEREPSLSRSLALELYRRGFEQGMAEAGRRTEAQGLVDPMEVERIGRELFERGYRLGLMQGQAAARAAMERHGMNPDRAGRAALGRDAEERETLVRPGRYAAGPFRAEFMADGTFTMTRTDKVREVEGDWEARADRLMLNDVSGDIGDATFPMTCRAEPIENGFRLTGSRKGCQELVGMEFTRTDSPRG
jgi:hypothetical protein